jgi:serine/threonine-protein kinase HipA
MLAFLQLLASRLIQVPQLLQHYGCPQEILQFPTIGFDRLEQKLRTMGIYHG